ncbi:GIDE domain-containing protein [Sinimarinibacterium thermocellulolyticum]|uniref:RING-type E3 ubiquitin transferase n=1 Tax=Sinimarinibacterium thermocellulolyticum TaxID=3170016 RepID=A0ABV2A7F7_9GAMM
MLSDGLPWIGLAQLLADADAGWFWPCTLLALGAALASFVLAFVSLKHARLIEDTPTSRIRSAAQGYVEIQGRARLMPGPDIVSPLTGTRCCWWQYRVQRIEGSGRNRRWRTIESATSDELFLLVDETGDCVVDPTGAKVHPSLRRRWRGHGRRPSQVPEKTPWLQFGDYRYDEALIAEGDALYALGWFRTQSGAPSFDERAELSALLRAWKADQADLIARFDADGDGRIDLQEWEAARRAALEQVRRDHVERAVDPDVHVLCRPRDRRPFVLSTLPQRELARRYRFSGVAMLVFSFVSGACGIFALISRGLL